MNFKLVTYNHNGGEKFNFFIQSKGNNAGRPLREPKANCWGVQTNIPYAFELCTILWMAKIYKHSIRGSVIPFLTISDYKKITTPFLRENIICEDIILKGLESINKIDDLINATLSKLTLIKEMKKTTTNKILYEIKTKI